LAGERAKRYVVGGRWQTAVRAACRRTTCATTGAISRQICLCASCDVWPALGVEPSFSPLEPSARRVTGTYPFGFTKLCHHSFRYYDAVGDSMNSIQGAVHARCTDEDLRW